MTCGVQVIIRFDKNVSDSKWLDCNRTNNNKKKWFCVEWSVLTQNHEAIILTDITIAVWFTISGNHHFRITILMFTLKIMMMWHFSTQTSFLTSREQALSHFTLPKKNGSIAFWILQWAILQFWLYFDLIFCGFIYWGSLFNMITTIFSKDWLV